MKTLIKIILITYLLVFFSGCNQQNLAKPTKPKINNSLLSINVDTMKHISNMTSIALEWEAVADTNSHGYYIYRSKIQRDGQKLTRIKTLDTRYTTHFVDYNLEPNTQYLYAISSIGQDGQESIPSNTYMAKTLPRFKSVSFIDAVSNLPHQIKIIWRPHANLSVKSYIIERSSQETLKWKVIEEVEGRLNAEYIDLNLDNNKRYTYRVIVTTFDGDKSSPSKIVTGQTKPLPLIVTNIQASYNLPKQIKLTWNTPKTSDIKFYRIYKGTAGTNKFFSKIAEINPTNTLYIDGIDEDGVDAYYKVTVVDKDDLESTRDISSVIGRTLSKPSKPTITLAMIEDDKAIIKWMSGDNRATSYNIIKTIRNGYFSSKKIVIPNIQGLKFEDKDILRGVTYEYSIEAIDTFGLKSEKTSATSITLPKLEKQVNKVK